MTWHRATLICTSKDMELLMEDLPEEGVLF